MRAFDNEDIDAYFGTGVSLPSNSLYMGSIDVVGKSDEESGTDFRMAERVLKGLDVLQNNSTEPITIYMNNVGGDEYHGLAIYDAIQTCRNKVIIKVFGQASSMGSIILQAASKRILAPHSVVMVHMGDLSASIDQRDIEAHTKEWKRINELVYDIYLSRMREKNSRYSINQLRDLLSTDRHLSPQEAVELGLADEVLK